MSRNIYRSESLGTASDLTAEEEEEEVMSLTKITEITDKAACAVWSPISVGLVALGSKVCWFSFCVRRVPVF